MNYNFAELWRELVIDEGRRSKPYLCPSGQLTIGVGHNLSANGLPPEIIDSLLRYDIEVAEKSLNQTDPDWREHPEEVQRALINLVFNLGSSRWEQFKATRAALRRRDYLAASNGLEHSKWATQVQRSRRDRIIGQFRRAAEKP